MERKFVKTTMFVAALAVSIAGASSTFAADTPAAPRVERVKFAKGASSAKIEGTMKGGADVDYVVRAAAGQTLDVKLDAKNAQNNFLVLPPASNGAAMYSSRDTGVQLWKGMLPTDGDYVIRVFLDRPAARRNESSRYTLTVGVTGTALPPLAAGKDARVKGTPYNATASIKCQPPFESAMKACDAGVIRRGTDGTATVEVKGSNGVVRRLLFVGGKPVVSDAAVTVLTFTREGDVTIVKVGQDERYDVPDPFLRGG